MRAILFISLFLTCFWGCINETPKKKLSQQNDTLLIKNCKIYSSDFVLLNPDEKGQLIQEFCFNDSGFVTELIRYGLDGKIVGRFDISGQSTPFPLPENPIFIDTVLIHTEVDSLGNIIHKEVKTYNKKGLLTEVKYYQEANKLVQKNTYLYDTLGLIKEDVYWDVELNKPKQKIRYEFEFLKH